MTNIALLTKYNSYIGREYASNLINNNIRFTFITFGSQYEGIDAMEDHRCGGKWRPESMSDLKKKASFINFSDIDSVEFKDYIQDQKITLGIQGDVGKIISKEVIDLFSEGIFNFHPGDLPKYRGCSAPEWQLHDGNKIICTCHFINEALDKGDIIEKTFLDLPKYDYHKIRASIYPEISKFVVHVISKFIKKCEINSYPQHEYDAVYREYIGEDKINEIIYQLKDEN